MVINPYDDQAVELALRLKEKNGGKITALTLGIKEETKVIKHALSMGIDEGIILADERFIGLDSFSTAYILVKGIRKIGDYDLILCGRESADWGEGLVGPIIAGKLDLPMVTLAEAIEGDVEELRVKRVTLDGYQIFSVPTPALVTVSSEVGQPRLPSGWGIVSATRKQVPTWNAGDIDVDPSQMMAVSAHRKLKKLYIPESVRRCKIIEGDTTCEATEKLAEQLRQAGVI